MPVALKELECPNCGSTVSQFNATSQTLVCQACNTHLDAAEGQIISSGSKLPPPPKPIILGQTGTFMHGAECVVLGRVDYEGWDSSDRWKWHEWLLGANDGRMYWLAYDDEAGFGLFHKRHIKAPFNPALGRVIPLEKGGRTINVKERYPARIVGVEGELTWLAKQDQKLNVIDAAGNGRRYSIQYTPQAIEMYEGIALEEEAVARAFQSDEWLKRTKQRAKNKELMLLSGAAFFLFGLLSLILAAVFSTSGTLVAEDRVRVNRNEPAAVIPFEVDSINRPMLIRLNSSSLPVNSWAQLEVSITDPLENETVIGGNEFWHETGVDEDGTWNEADYSGSSSFIPLETGTHQLKIEFEDSAANVNGTSVGVEVYRNHFVGTWLIVYGIVALIGGVGFVAFSQPKKTGNLISSMFEDD